MKRFCYGSTFLLRDNSVLAPLKLLTFETGLLSYCVNWQSAKPVTALTTLMLLLPQVNAFHSNHHQTLFKHSTVNQKQDKYDDSGFCRSCKCRIFFERCRGKTFPFLVGLLSSKCGLIYFLADS